MVAEKSTKVIKERAEMNQSPMCYECSILGQRNVGCIVKVGEVEYLVWPPSSILGEGEELGSGSKLSSVSYVSQVVGQSPCIIGASSYTESLDVS